MAKGRGYMHENEPTQDIALSRRHIEFVSDESFILEQAQRVAINATIAASEHVMQYWPNPSNSAFNKARVMEIFDKQEGVGNFATIADVESENMLISAIRSNPLLRNHDIITEESGDERKESPWQWCNDPIDGTLNFTNGLPDFAISMGLLYRGEPVLGVIAVPERRQFVVGRKGKGAKLISFGGKEIADLRELVQEVTLPLRKSIVGHDLSYVDRRGQVQDFVVKVVDNVGAFTSYYSTVYANVKVAQGLLAGYMFKEPKIYDIAAAGAILPESGCVISGMDGKPIDWQAPTRTYLAARNNDIHAQLLDILGS